MSLKRSVTVAAFLFAPIGPGASGSIIDDKSDFVGDYTVIDFETYGDGTPLVLGDGEVIELLPDEYDSLGISVTASENVFGNERGLLANLRDFHFDAAQEAVNLGPNSLFANSSDGFIRFDFGIAVNGIGLTVINITSASPVRLEAWGGDGQLLKAAEFGGALVDGTIPGDEFGHLFDLDYGFFGVFSPQQDISFAVLYEDGATVEEVYFGVIPEPVSILLFAVFSVLVTCRRRAGPFRRATPYAMALVVMLSTVTPSAGIIIDDKADFVGDFTVIDFETWGDGTPLILGEGDAIKIPCDEYSMLGVTISTSFDIASNDYRPVVGNGLSAHSNAVHELAGSPPNEISDRAFNGFLRFEFWQPVNAVGLTVINVPDGGPVFLHVFDDQGTLLEFVDFDGDLVDGSVPGDPFGEPFDFEYGFFGAFTPESEIAYAIVSEDLTVFDDIYFGVIPEPATLTLLMFGAFGVCVRRRRRRYGSGFRLLLLVSGFALVAVTVPASAFIIDDKSDFVGDFTVIDFETRGDGTALLLVEGAFIRIPTDEYSNLGVTITASFRDLTQSDLPVVANDFSPVVDAAQELVGSPRNEILDGAPPGFLRFDFSNYVNSIGVAVINRVGGPAVRLEVYDISDEMIMVVDFEGELIDGTVLGSDFEGDFSDFDYGFFGAFTPDQQIAYAVLTEGSTAFDDLHFGIIPEPGSVALLGLVGFHVLTRRRRGGARRRFLATPGFLLFALTGSGVFAGIIDDKSDFVGDYTVIDFEAWGDGTPLILHEGEGIEVPPDEYMSLAAVISSSINLFGRYRPFVGNGMPDAQTDGAHMAVGSIPNTLFVNGRNGFLRIDFAMPVNAVALSTMNWTDGEGVRLEAYDSDDQLIESVDFSDSLVDGAILGSDFGNSYDIEYGFFGLFTPTDDIAFAIIREDRAVFDDLHFGVIPEPTTLTLMMVGAFGVCVRRRQRRYGSGFRLLPLLSAFALVAVTVPASAFIIDDKSDFVGDFTVIDFETRGDGTPLILDEGDAIKIACDEYFGARCDHEYIPRHWAQRPPTLGRECSQRTF